MMKQLFGVLIKDMPLYLRNLIFRNKTWWTVCNRADQLELAPDRSGCRCVWEWTSELHAPKLIPALGRLLMSRAFAVHPIRLIDILKREASAVPQITFLIGHRGMERLPHLLATLQSIASQQGVEVECIVIEQDVDSKLGPHLPSWVRLVHTPPPVSEMPYCRAWTFNVGAQHARSEVLVLHDNDILVPIDYAATIIKRLNQGYEVVNLKRFVFYLTQTHTDNVLSGKAKILDAAPVGIVQNLEGGGSIAINRSAYHKIGGLDESFIGWGGEDNEFWERAQTLRVWSWANMPFVHLWHVAQQGKKNRHYHTALLYQRLRNFPPHERIRRLLSKPRGQMSGPIQSDIFL